MTHSTSLSPSAADSKVNITASDVDLELGATPMSTNSTSVFYKTRGGVDPYPCRATQKRLRREQKLARAKCACWANMSKNSRKAIIVGSLVVFIAVITVMAIMISKATGSGVYGKHGATNAAIS
ncbi:hypothetical protein LSUE1_G010221 [Lachnellula suecica]|uniref:Uncharacterized protein n=1 Tax=Lachnellula suecica TaxID=602035 RepID=A0A8T9BQA5_9HELO|nr:hypothetical protein LSUE1_G010221 [Lachnellula suecica]